MTCLFSCLRRSSARRQSLTLNSCWLRSQSHLSEERRFKKPNLETEVKDGQEMKENLYFQEHPRLVQHTGKPHSRPTLHTKSVCTDIFISPQDIVVMLVKCKPRPVQHMPFSLIWHYVNPCKGLCSLCYSKQSVGVVDKEMQSGSPLTPGSLCKQYGELLGTLLITL